MPLTSLAGRAAKAGAVERQQESFSVLEVPTKGSLFCCTVRIFTGIVVVDAVHSNGGHANTAVEEGCRGDAGSQRLVHTAIPIDVLLMRLTLCGYPSALSNFMCSGCNSRLLELDVASVVSGIGQLLIQFEQTLKQSGIQDILDRLKGAELEGCVTIINTLLAILMQTSPHQLC